MLRKGKGIKREMKIYPQFCSITLVVLENTRKVLQSALPVWAAKLDQSKSSQERPAHQDGASTWGPSHRASSLQTAAHRFPELGVVSIPLCLKPPLDLSSTELHNPFWKTFM